MPQRFYDRITKHIARQGKQPAKIRQLAQAMGIAQGEYGDFRKAVKSLAKTGRIVLGSANALTLPQPGRTMVGRYRANPKGFGFVIPDQPNAHGDLYVPRGQAGGAVTGDTVVARVFKEGHRGGKMIYRGRIVEIVSRGQSKFVGELCHELSRWFVRPDGNTLHVPIFVGDPKAKRARAGDKVVVEITEYPTDKSDARGVIVRVLGPRGDPGVETQSIICQYQLPDEFPEAVTQAAAAAVATFDPRRAARDRDDLRDLTVITIDPATARDFDDAISLEPTGHGGWELGVHIADVAYFVRPGEPLDTEAHKRATSVYFPHHVIPMLPEVLSNGVCSLQERRPRLTKSAFITYNAQGHRTATRFANTVIHSTKRLTYEQATRMLDGKVGRVAPKVVDLVRQMEVLARLIRQRRIEAGMLSLDLPSPELILDDDGKVTGVESADTSFSHTIIEMFMVEANEAVAELLAGLGVPNLRRVHPPPDEGAAEPLSRFLAALGLPALKTMDRMAIQALLRRVAGRPEAQAVNYAVLRSLQQAVYEPGSDGHFALAGEDYVHFTSPIRRYPDLTIHRLFDDYVTGRLTRKRRPTELPSLEAVEELGKHCSNNQRRAEAAERELIAVFILQLLAKDLGNEYDGMVTGVANFGVFVQLTDYFLDGLLRFEDLPDDWWEADVAAGCVIGQRSGIQLRIGDRLRVRTAAIDLSNRKLDLALVSGLRKAARRSPAPARAPSRAQAKTDRRPAPKRKAADRRPRSKPPKGPTGRTKSKPKPKSKSKVKRPEGGGKKPSVKKRRRSR
ncbi:MAG: ribonuclease R [Planctomycetes bacterium]|nr:ribonuclease R [Planctomycetota bacterium]